MAIPDTEPHDYILYNIPPHVQLPQIAIASDEWTSMIARQFTATFPADHTHPVVVTYVGFYNNQRPVTLADLATIATNPSGIIIHRRNCSIIIIPSRNVIEFYGYHEQAAQFLGSRTSKYSITSINWVTPTMKNDLRLFWTYCKIPLLN